MKSKNSKTLSKGSAKTAKPKAGKSKTAAKGKTAAKTSVKAKSASKPAAKSAAKTKTATKAKSASKMTAKSASSMKAKSASKPASKKGASLGQGRVRASTGPSMGSVDTSSQQLGSADQRPAPQTDKPFAPTEAFSANAKGAKNFKNASSKPIRAHRNVVGARHH